MYDDRINEKELINVLKLVSPGTILRTAIDDILRAGMGALIVVDAPELRKISEGGFKITCKLTSQKIVELAKMDGAIILSSDLSKILYSNILLVPDVSFSTTETGTRHKAAERTSKQVGSLVIAISERRKRVTLYYHKIRYILQNTEELLSRATETLQILEKQREIFDELLSNLNVLEISNLVVINDVSSMLQRIGIITRTSRKIERYLTELGKEGLIIRMRLRELLKGIDAQKEFIFKDYNVDNDKQKEFEELSFDELLDVDNLSKLLFPLPGSEKVTTRGYRILRKTNLQTHAIENLIKNLDNLDNILNNSEKLEQVLGNYTENFLKDFSSLKEQILMARKI